MLVLITYDIANLEAGGAKRLRNIAKICQDYGQRVQFSVFECVVDNAKWVSVKNRLIRIINKETDSLRFYYLGNNWKQKIEHVGAKEAYDIEGPLIF
jgi:CRISPR-associated protein Cas2